MFLSYMQQHQSEKKYVNVSNLIMQIVHLLYHNLPCTIENPKLLIYLLEKRIIYEEKVITKGNVLSLTV